MTALVVLSSETYLSAYTEGAKPLVNGAALSAAAYGDALSGFGRFVISISTVFFSLSTILGWGYYGEVCIAYIFKAKAKKAVFLYRAIFVIFVFIGAIAEISLVWLLADCFNALMALPNLIAIVALSGVIKSATIKHFADRKAGKEDLNDSK
jgi:AGCS family alanine or glycine:cation symporter